MEGWVDLGYPAVHRQGVEPAIFRPQVRRPTTTLDRATLVRKENSRRLLPIVRRPCACLRRSERPRPDTGLRRIPLPPDWAVCTSRRRHLWSARRRRTTEHPWSRCVMFGPSPRPRPTVAWHSRPSSMNCNILHTATARRISKFSVPHKSAIPITNPLMDSRAGRGDFFRVQ